MLPPARPWPSCHVAPVCGRAPCRRVPGEVLPKTTRSKGQLSASFIRKQHYTSGREPPLWRHCAAVWWEAQGLAGQGSHDGGWSPVNWVPTVGAAVLLMVSWPPPKVPPRTLWPAE